MKDQKPTNQEIEKGQMVVLVMMKSEKGNRPVSRLEDGKICLIDRETKGFFPYDSVWECEVVEIREKSVIIKPKEMVVTAEANRFEMKKKLTETFGKPVKERKQKVKRQFPNV